MDQQAPNGAADYMVQPGGGPDGVTAAAVAAAAAAAVNGIIVSSNGGGGATGTSTPSSSGGVNNNDAKRAKLEGGQSAPGGGGNAPSRVIHIRNIPSDVSEAEIIHLGIPFGRVTNVLVLKGKNQAFLEMDDEASASNMVNYYTNCVAQLRDRSVYVQFSNHKELKTDQTHSNASASAQAALQAAQALIGQEPGSAAAQAAAATAALVQGGSMSPKIHGAVNGGGGGGGGGGGPNTVLRVIVEHMVYPVTLDVIFQIFSRVGKVLKIVTFTKNNTFQALIQYPDVITAQAAKLSLDGQNIYNGCCTLRIEYSKLSNLNVKYNNDKSRDYTNPALPTGDPTMDLQGAVAVHQAANAAGAAGATGQNMLAAAGAPFSAAAAAAMGMGLTNHLAAAYGSAVPGAAGAAGMGGAAAAGLAGFSHLANAAAAGGQMFGQSGAGGLRFTPGVGVAGQLGGAAGGATAANPMAGIAAAAAGHPGALGTGCVLLVSNLDEHATECDHLFILFGVYGDVHRVKILFNKKDTALIQMAEPHQALLAMNHLDKVKLWGKAMRVMPSKHTQVQLPKEGQPDAGLTKDFSSSSLHRFKKPGSKNYSNIYPPSATLHLSNIPSSVEEDDLRNAFANIGLQVQAFKFFPKDRKMALVQLATVDDSVVGLIKLHNYQLSETSHLRVSFSKSTI